MTRPISDWKLDCLDCVAERNEHRVIIDLECARQDRQHCRKRPGMDGRHFDDKGICDKYELSHPCDEDGTEIEEG